MISSKEMKYVNAKNEVPYPGDNYSKDALLELKNALYLYEAYYKDREYDVVFSNGENLEFSIPEKNLSHIVGLNYNVFKDNNIAEKICGNNDIASYELIKLILENENDILKLNETNNYSLINFYRLKSRSEVFTKFSNFTDFNFGCIFFDEDIGKKNGYSTNMKSKKYLFTESDDPGYDHYMLAIAYNEQFNNPYVESLFLNKYSSEMFKEQEIAMPTLISTTTPKSYEKKEATSSQKLKLIKSFVELEKKYGAKFSFYNDYVSLLAEQAREESRKKVLSI